MCDQTWHRDYNMVLSLAHTPKAEQNYSIDPVGRHRKRPTSTSSRDSTTIEALPPTYMQEASPRRSQMVDIKHPHARMIWVRQSSQRHHSCCQSAHWAACSTTQNP